jgi:hypothetical protein
MTDPFDGDVEVAELYAAQVREWSKWEAREDIHAGAALAYAAGHPVPAANVERHGYAQAGRVRLQARWVADNPDDDDVKRFQSWAKSHPDHPDVVAVQEYAKARAEREAAAVDDNPFAEEPAPRKASKSTAPTADKE